MDTNRGDAEGVGTLERCLACEADGRNHWSAARLVADCDQKKGPRAPLSDQCS